MPLTPDPENVADGVDKYDQFEAGVGQIRAGSGVNGETAGGVSERIENGRLRLDRHRLLFLNLVVTPPVVVIIAPYPKIRTIHYGNLGISWNFHSFKPAKGAQKNQEVDRSIIRLGD